MTPVTSDSIYKTSHTANDTLDPEHCVVVDEAVGEEEKAETTNRCKRFYVSAVDGCPLEALDKLLNTEEERHQGERLVVRPLMTRGQMMRIKT